MLLGEAPEDYDKHFKLMADIDLSGYSYDRAVIAPDTNDTKPEFQGTSFGGVFDGNGYTISNLTIEGESMLGLFGRLGSETKVRNLGLIDVKITGSTISVGGLTGSNSGEVIYCYCTGSVSGISSVGGLAGWNNGSVIQCYSTGSVMGGEYLGGLVGQNRGNVTHSYSTAAVRGVFHVGGLVGLDYGNVTCCYSTGAISGTDYIGGLVGSGNFDVLHSVWDTETSGLSRSAGGTGKTTAEMQMDITFLAWGACGNEGIWKIEVGIDYPRLWWEDKLGQPIEAHLPDFLIGEGTLENPYIISTLEDIDIATKFTCEQDKYFRLEFLEGDGIQESPYLIHTADELDLLGKCPYELDKYFKLMADIDLWGRSYDSAVVAPDTDQDRSWYQGIPFTGVFDGNGHIISHLTIVGKSYLGLFGISESGSKVKDLGVADVNIIGSGGSVGGLAAVSSGDVTGCYSTGAVSGEGSVGGLVGGNSGSIANCYSTCVVTDADPAANPWSQDSFGGLVGDNVNTFHDSSGEPVVFAGTITHCYSAGAVSGYNNAGGLVGISFGQVAPPLPQASVAIDGFWDIETSGRTSMCGQRAWFADGCDDSKGKTTSEMQTAATFLEAGWDFVYETANGTEDIWWILEGQDYPRLWWELIDGG